MTKHTTTTTISV